MMQKDNRIEIKRLESAFVPQVTALEQAAFRNPWSQNSISAEIGNDLSRFLLAVEGRRLAGYLAASFVADEGAVNRVAVALPYRRQGVASLLLCTLLKEAWAAGLSFVTLEVRQSNLPAISLYQKFGFRPVGLRQGFYRNPTEDAVLMTVHREEAE